MATTNQTLDGMVDALVQPRIPRLLPGILRCADLYCGDGDVSAAAFATGIEIAYAYELDADTRDAYLGRFGLEPFAGTTGDSVRMAPPFDLLLVRLTADALTAPPAPPRGRQKHDSPVEHAMRFLRVRRPVGILFIGEGLPAGFADSVREATQEEMTRFGYRVEQRSGRLEAIAGVLSTEPFPWPPVLTLGSVIEGLARVAQEPTRIQTSHHPVTEGYQII